jgi:hypothetical protein
MSGEPNQRGVGQAQSLRVVSGEDGNSSSQRDYSSAQAQRAEEALPAATGQVFVGQRAFRGELKRVNYGITVVQTFASVTEDAIALVLELESFAQRAANTPLGPQERSEGLASYRLLCQRLDELTQEEECQGVRLPFGVQAAPVYIPIRNAQPRTGAPALCVCLLAMDSQFYGLGIGPTDFLAMTQRGAGDLLTRIRSALDSLNKLRFDYEDVHVRLQSELSGMLGNRWEEPLLDDAGAKRRFENALIMVRTTCEQLSGGSTGAYETQADALDNAVLRLLS